MNEQCAKAGLPQPLYYYATSGFWVVFHKDTINEQSLKELGLTNRQVNALLFFKEKGEITAAEYAKKYKASDRTVRRDLFELAEKKLLKNKGDTNLSKYIFA